MPPVPMTERPNPRPDAGEQHRSAELDSAQCRPHPIDAAHTEFQEDVVRLRGKDLILLPAPSKWPMFPFLCLTHRCQQDPTGLPQVGLIWAERPNSVFPVNVYSESHRACDST